MHAVLMGVCVPHCVGECLLSRVHLVAICRTAFCTIRNLFVSDMMGDQMVFTYASKKCVMVL